jgi:predicted permease
VDALLLRYLPRGDVGRSIVGDLHEEYAGIRQGVVANTWYAVVAFRLLAGYAVTSALRRAQRVLARRRKEAGTSVMRIAGMREDLRDAVRGLRRHPGWAAAALCTFALGIGVTTGVFSIVYGTLLQPLPYHSPEDLVRIGERPVDSPEGSYWSMSGPNFLDLEAAARQFEMIEAYRHRLYNVTSDAGPSREVALDVTPGFFTMLRVQPVLGRGFGADDATAGAAPVVVLSDALWREKFGSDRTVVGRSIVIDHVPRTVIGILPAGITWPGAPRLYAPLVLEATTVPEARRRRWLEGAGRLRSGVSIEQGRAELQSQFARIAADHPEANERMTVSVGSLTEWMVGGSRSLLLLSGGATLLVLLIACVNVANLGIARALDRRHELSVRAALGAGRSRLARHMVLENLMVSLLGGLLGILLAVWVTKAMLALYGRTLYRADEIAIDLPVLAFAVGISLLSGLSSSLAPVLQLHRFGLHSRLREGGRGSMESGRRLRQTLVTVQVALAVLLSTGAGLLIRTVWRLERTDLGVDARSVLVFDVGLPAVRYASLESITGFYGEFLARIEAIPGAQRAAAITRRPLFGGTNNELIPRRGDAASAQLTEVREVTRGFFDAIGVHLLEGRLFLNSDSRTGGVAVVNASLAAKLFPGRSAIGQTVTETDGAPAWEIVGVVSNVNEFGPTQTPRPTIYWPYGSQGMGDFASRSMSIVVRTAGDPLAVLPAIREQLRAMDRDLPLSDIASLEDLAARAVGQQRRSAMVLLGWLAVLALILGSIGIYGVIAFTVTRRRRELGVRVALGAGTQRVAWLVIRQAMQLALAGTALGFAAALAGTRLLTGLLHGVHSTDPLTMAIVAVVLAASAFVASAFPAFRATRVPPVEALRTD